MNNVKPTDAAGTRERVARDSDPRPGVTLGVVTIVMTLIGWTSIPLFLKFFTKDIDGYNANGWRYGFSALMWLPPLIWAWGKGSLPKGLWKAALIPALFNTIGQHCFGIAPYKIDPGLMTFSLRTQVIFVTIGAFMMFPIERKVIKTWGYMVGLGMVLLGTCVMLVLKPGGLGGATGEGVAISLVSGASYAAYALSVRRQMHGMNPLLAFAAVSQYTAIALIGIMLVFGNGHGLEALKLLQPTGQEGWIGLPGARFALLLLSALIGIGMGHTFYFLAIQRLGLAVANSVVQLQPITVSIVSMFIFNEVLTGWQWCFGVVAVSGAGVILWAQRRAELARRRAALALELETGAPGEELLMAEAAVSRRVQ